MPSHAPAAPSVELADGTSMPQLGYGVFQVPDEQAADLVTLAIEAGYRSIDTAAVYRNETGTGEGIRASSVPREQLFVTTKCWNDDQGFDRAIAAYEASLRRLRMDAVDLYLVHWPAPSRGLWRDTWRALVQLREEGRVGSVGVSNFVPEHLRRVIDDTGVVPALNQVELHPYFQQRELREAHDELGVVTEAWSPLGQGGELLEDPVLVAIAEEVGRTVAQVVLRWHMQHGFVTIPKSATPSRIAQNIDVFDFELDAGQVARIDALDRGEAGRIGPDPVTATF